MYEIYFTLIICFVVNLKMKFSMFVLVFSLCSGLTVSFSIEIEDEIGIQIWQTYEEVNRLINEKKCSSFSGSRLDHIHQL